MAQTKKDKSKPLINTDRVLTLLGALGTLFLVILLLAFLIGGPMNGFLRKFGLEIPELRGVFIDCSNPKNRGHTFCEPLPKRTNPEKDRRNLYDRDPKSLPFNLSN